MSDTMNTIIRKRIAALRSKMSELGIDYYLIPTADYHNSEYVAPYFQTRAYFSGFTGSNGTLVVGMEEAGLWTDGRYFIQAEKELAGTGVDLYREMEEGVPSISEWLEDRMPVEGTLGFDGGCISIRQTRSLRKKLARKKVRFAGEYDPAAEIWTDRPPLPSHPAFVLGEEYGGESTASKLARLREKMRQAGARIYVESKLDNLMWLFNLRGGDVECTPVALSFGVVTMDRQILFIQDSEVTEAVREYADSISLELRPYENVYAFLQDPELYRNVSMLPDSRDSGIGAGADSSEKTGQEDTEKNSGNNLQPGCRVLFNPGSLSTRLYNALQRGREAADIRTRTHYDIEKRSPVEDFKAAKNQTEMKNIRAAYREDSAAVCRFLYWLRRHVENGTVTELTEYSAAEKMDSLRAGISDFIELSFGTISAYGPNAAMMHYSAKKDDCAQLRPEGMLLVDCGGQYLRGTTDVTRTIALGPVSDDMRRHYTLTAVGNLQLMEAVFLHGCSGRNVDILARQPLWSSFVDYKCGTGHGIGYLLGVHEGPQNIRWRYSGGMEEAVLEPGMIVSDEPGVYIEGQYGIRIETILEVAEAAKNGDGRFLRFRPLTFVPFDPALIDPAYLTPQTRDALNRYHARVYEEIAPLLDENERVWLRSQTQPI